MENDLKKILDAVEENSAELIEFCREIVKIPSYSGDEEAVAKVIAKWMHEFEFDNVMIDELGSVIGFIEGKAGNDHLLLFDAHMDHVDVGRRDVWDFEPFGAIVKDNAIYGRGVVDMKGALASQIFALGMIIRYEITPPTDLCMAAVVFEELNEGLAVKHVIENIGNPDCVVLGEPSNLNLSVGQRGRAEIEIVTKGKTSHGSMPELGKNAIFAMTPIINEIKLLNDRLPSHPFLGKGSVTIIDISSSPGGNVVPDKCRIVVDRRIIPGETEDVVLNEMHDVLNTVKEHISDFEVTVKIIDEPVKFFTKKTRVDHKYFPTWYFDPSMPLIQKAKTVLEKAVDQQVEVIKWLFSTDGVYTAGTAKLPTIGFGPGEEEQAHTPNEHLAIDQLIKSAKGYAALALSLLSK
ncbi:MAG: YgeY family selenium metabolism-linked hydrolase [Candidatus Sifarchaeia archaeon]